MAGAMNTNFLTKEDEFNAALIELFTEGLLEFKDDSFEQFRLTEKGVDYARALIRNIPELKDQIAITMIGGALNAIEEELDED